MDNLQLVRTLALRKVSSDTIRNCLINAYNRHNLSDFVLYSHFYDEAANLIVNYPDSDCSRYLQWKWLGQVSEESNLYILHKIVVLPCSLWSLISLYSDCHLDPSCEDFRILERELVRMIEESLRY